MLTAEAHIQTERASRYLVQLCRHADSMNHKGHRIRLHVGKARVRPELLHVEYSDTDGILRLNWGQCTMRASPDTLTLSLEATDEEDLRRIQDLITADLERFGTRDHLTVDWVRPGALTDQAGEAG
jgi:hypothetical protein